MLHKQNCSKFMLNPLLDPGDAYHLHSGTGQLKTLNSEIITHDDYCMDYFDIGYGEQVKKVSKLSLKEWKITIT
jgi:hypothetical protein